MILEPRKIKSDTVSTVSPSISHEVMEPDAMIFTFCWGPAPVDPENLKGRQSRRGKAYLFRNIKEIKKKQYSRKI